MSWNCDVLDVIGICNYFFSQQCDEARDASNAMSTERTGQLYERHVDFVLVIHMLWCIFNILIHIFTIFCTRMMYCKSISLYII